MDVELEGTTILTEGDLHDALNRALDFGPYYGRNLEALYDRLNHDVERPIRIICHDHAVSRSAIGDDSFRRIVQVFDFVVASDSAAGTEPPFSYALA